MPNKRVSRSPKLIDLFCGAGGLTLGFTGAFGHEFQPAWANDLDPRAAETYSSNFGAHCSVGNIGTLLKDPSNRIPKADVVIGGPPCQGFSLLNKNRQNDSRKQLWRPFLEVVKASGADIFLMENVPQLLESGEYEEILKTAEQEMQFKVRSAKLVAADYGVPQVRTRAFILGCKFMDPNVVFPPKRTHFNPNNKNLEPADYVDKPCPWRTVRDAIADLPAPLGTDIRLELPPMDLHFGRSPRPISVKRYLAIPKEGMNRFDLQKRALHLTPPCWIRKTSGGTDLFGRLWWNRPAFTMRTEFFKPEKGRYLHPSQHRPITHREAARFQSFPDDFKFCGTKIEIARQIGNAVPPLLAARLADCVTELLRRRHDGRLT
jgi:DNA (cytosine-5)-methyltransferase 1